MASQVVLLEGLPYSEMVLEFTLLEDEDDPLDSSRQHGEAFIGETVFTTRHETVRPAGAVGAGAEARPSLR